MGKSYNQPTCPVACALDLLGDRWTLLIIRELLRGKGRFADFEASLPGVPSNVLSERLKLLEAEGVVARRFYCEHPPRAEYYLTPKGLDLREVIRSLFQWGATHVFEETGTQLVHRTCGHEVSLHWACEHCGDPDVGRDLVTRDRYASSRQTPA